METGTPYMLYKDACNAKSNQQVGGATRMHGLPTKSHTTRTHAVACLPVPHDPNARGGLPAKAYGLPTSPTRPGCTRWPADQSHSPPTLAAPPTAAHR
eukprot:3180288-Prymnesium_polylepis.1